MWRRIYCFATVSLLILNVRDFKFHVTQTEGEPREGRGGHAFSTLAASLAAHKLKDHAPEFLPPLLVLLLVCIAIIRFNASLPHVAHTNWPLRFEEALVLLSALLNTAAFGAFVYLVKSRGGIAYLKSCLKSLPYMKRFMKEEATAKSDPGVVGRQSLFELLPPAGARPIVFLGDSITASCEWREMFGGETLILNRGIGGDTSAGALMRADSVAALKPLAVFLMIGTNDPQLLNCSPEQTVANVRSIVELILRKSPQTVIYLQSILPSGVMKFNRWSSQVNELISQLADGQSVVFLNLRPAFLTGDLLNPRCTADGLHLNGFGYLVWKTQIEPIMKELILQQRNTAQIGAFASTVESSV